MPHLVTLSKTDFEMNRFLVIFGQVMDRQTDRQTDCEANELTVHKHRCAKTWLSKNHYASEGPISWRARAK